MPVKIRLTRMGKKKQPTYRLVVMDSRKQRDGAYIEQIGFYDPRQDPSLIEIDNEVALKWLRNGAQPTDRARKLLEISGAWTQFKVAKGEIHVAASVATPEPEIHVVEHVEPAPVDETDVAPVAAADDAAGDDAGDDAEETQIGETEGGEDE